MSSRNPFLERVYEDLLETKRLGPGEMPSPRHFLNHVCGTEMMAFSNSLADALRVDPLEIYTVVMNCILAGMATRLPDETAEYLRLTADVIVASKTGRASADLLARRRELIDKIHVAASLDVFYGAEVDRSKMS